MRGSAPSQDEPLPKGRPMSIRSFARVGACACVAALVLAACGSDDKKSDAKTGKIAIDTPATVTSMPTNASGDGAKTASDAACKLITAEDAGTLFGGTVTQQADASPSAVSSSVCIWDGKVDGVSYLLQIRIGEGEEFYTGNIPGNEPLDGVGDKAAIREAGNGAEETISYLKDGRSYTIALSAHEVGTTQLAKAKRDQLISLVKSTANK
jgi:hypothetical protein